MDISSLQFPSLLSGFAAGESGGIPQTVFHIDMPGFSNDTANSDYAACRSRGGSDSACAHDALQNQGLSTSNTPQIGEPDFWSKIKRSAAGAFGIAGDAFTGGGFTTAAKGSATLSQLSVSRIATGIVGVILIGAALFMLGISSFNPISQIKEVVE